MPISSIRGVRRELPLPLLMPLGDSITFGAFAGSTGGYRQPLSDTLNGKYLFIGSVTSGDFANNRCEGHSGYYIKGSVPNGTYGQGIYENVPNWLPLYPDVILLHIGTNTLAATYNSGTAASDAATELGQLLTFIRSYTTVARIYVASIIPLDAAKRVGLTLTQFNTLQAAMTSYNSLIPGVLSGFSNVQFVDMAANAGLVDADYADMTHPNSTGYTKMAAVWAASGI